ncbi:MAG: twin-arginine translocase TatA/TatE family subunit [Thermoleophilia bacterium]|nr:twin-arginine translocase TatA/TatE family subunit [Thermoleophilia bacterium]
MPFGIGPLELIIILAIILLAFGAKRLPEIGRSLGGGMREFKKGVMGEKSDPDEQVTASVASDPALPAKTDETTPAA